MTNYELSIKLLVSFMLVGFSFVKIEFLKLIYNVLSSRWFVWLTTVVDLEVPSNIVLDYSVKSKRPVSLIGELISIVRGFSCSAG